MNAVLLRQQKTADCILGTLVLDNGQTFQTIERPYLDNLPDVSAIVEGTYKVIRWQSPSKGDCFKVLDVPGREHILIHAGNEAHESNGCILIGLERGPERVNHSRAALRGLMIEAPDGFRMRVMSV